MNKSIAAIALVFFVAGCWGDEWTGFAYPNKNDLTNHIEVGTFPSLQECRATALAAIIPTLGDYECGLNCGDGAFPRICEKTLR